MLIEHIHSRVDNYTQTNEGLEYHINGQVFVDPSPTIERIDSNIMMVHGLGYYACNHVVNEVVIVNDKVHISNVVSLSSEQAARELVEILQST